jgi:pimeloyl-ACP methyl ester carboxylesterase
VSLITAPRVEGAIAVRGGRELSFAEFGPPRGRPIVWLHGTPGGRRQIPQAARIAAYKLDMRLIGIDRPGVGLSTSHLYDSILDFTPDLEIVLDQLGVERVAIVGLSGGGPYALAAAHAFPARVAAVGVLGGVVPTQGGDAVDGGPIGLLGRFSAILPPLRIPMSLALSAFVRLLTPVASQAFDLYALISPEGDRRVLAEPEIKAMFLDDLIGNSRRGLGAPICDLILFTRPWGFSMTTIAVPVGWWHGNADRIVPIAHAHQAVPLIPHAELFVRPGESHLGGMAAAEEVLKRLVVMSDDRAERILPVPAGRGPSSGVNPSPEIDARQEKRLSSPRADRRSGSASLGGYQKSESRLSVRGTHQIGDSPNELTWGLGPPGSAAAIRA